MKYIAVALNAGTPAQRNLITNHFRSNNFLFWHWIDDLWIVQVHYATTPRSLYESILIATDAGRETIFLFEVNTPIKHYGRAPKEAWDWLKNIGRVE